MRAIKWKNLWKGISAIAVVLGIAVLILISASAGGIAGQTVTVYAAVNKAPGVLKGTEVWLAGQRIGQVRSVGFTPPSEDTANRVLIEMKVGKEYLPHIRANSEAKVRPEGNVLGAIVVSIKEGTPPYQQLAEGDTILGPSADKKGGPVLEQVAGLDSSFKELGANAKALKSDLEATKNRLGDVKPQLNKVRASWQALKKDVKTHPLRYINF